MTLPSPWSVRLQHVLAVCVFSHSRGQVCRAHRARLWTLANWKLAIITIHADAGRALSPVLMTKIGGRAAGRYNAWIEPRALGSVAYARRLQPFSNRFLPFSTDFASSTIRNRTIRVDARIHRGGSPRNVDSLASDADTIGIDPVHARWTVVDGADRWDVGRISSSPWPSPQPSPSRARRRPEPGGSPASHGRP
jgi:hypothetical protein